MKRLKIGVFDSGIGGASVLKKLVNKFDADFVYLADTKYVPYGEKTKEEIEQRFFECTKFLSENENIDMLVIACNTATTNALQFVEDKFPIKFIGFVPALDLALSKTHNQQIGVLATTATIRSENFQKIAKHKPINQVACPGLVEFIENCDLESEEFHNLLNSYLNKALQNNAKALVLGCTHYHYLRELLEKQLTNIQIVDSIEISVNKLKELKVKEGKANSVKYFCTANADLFSKQLQLFVDENALAKEI